MGVEVLNFGCRLNIAEGEAIRVAAEKAPLGNHERLIVVNSCAVTAEAERQARQAIRKAARANPDARIIVTGCGADVSRDRFAMMGEVSGVVANADKLLAMRYFSTAQPKNIELSDPQARYTPLTSGAAHARAFISVQNGCDHRCTFCIIPYGRGESRSAQIEEVVAACKAAVDRGQLEVVLTGVDLTSFDDAGKPLGALVAAIIRDVPALPRLRLSSLDSVEIDPLLEDLITSEPRLMPHVHLSLQAGDDIILKRMKRRHSRAQSISLVQRLKTKRPELAIGADMIAGFPTETDAMFLNTLALVEEADLVFGHIFPYSPRHGTPAALMPQVAPTLAKARATQLRTAVAARKAAWLRTLIGTVQDVLVELDGVSGHAGNFASVVLVSGVPTNAIRPESVEGLLPSSKANEKKGSPATDSGRTETNLTRKIVPTLITASDGTRLIGMPA